MKKQKSTYKSSIQFGTLASYFIITLLICSCAQISAPTGGERDNTPPKLKSENPVNKSTNFTGKEINLTFDEWIQPLQNPKSQVIISPNVDPFPKFEVERNHVKIKFKENTLQPNTTYSLFFGDNLKDNNEGNAFPNFKFLFSTGNFIDSLSVKGKLNTTDGKLEENTYLLLYNNLSDTAFTQIKPFYITKIDNGGNFNLENVKEGKYKIYSLTDKNNNFYFDLPTESIGFSDSIYDLTRNLDTLSFIHFLPEEEKWRIVSFDNSIKNGILNLKLNKEFSINQDEFTATLKEDTSINPICFPQEDGKSLKIYFPKMQKDTGNYTMTLFQNKQKIDSLAIRTESIKSKTPLPFFTDSSTYKNLVLFENKSLNLSSMFYATGKIDTSKISLKDTSKNEIPYTIHRKEDLSTYTIDANWKSGMKYKLVFQDSTFYDILNNYSKKQEFLFLAQSVKKGGNLLINIELPQKAEDYIVILSDNSGKVWDKRILRNSQAVKMEYGLLPADSYSIKIIEDKNKNGVWNSGSYLQKTIPEKTFVSKSILIKENWDAEENIKADFSLKAIIPQETKFGNSPKNENDSEGKFENSGIKNIPDRKLPGKN